MITQAILPDFVTEQHSEDASLYLLVDPLAGCISGDPLHLDSLRAELGADAITRLARPDLQHTPCACPVLVTLAGPGLPAPEPLLEFSAQRAEDDYDRHPYICGWLSSTATAQAVADHLISLGQFPAHPTSKFCAVYEPLRLELLAATFERGQHGPWWPVRRWLFPASCGRLKFLSCDEPSNKARPALAEQMQEEVPLINKLLRIWRDCLRLPVHYAPARWKGATPLPPHAGTEAFAQIHQARALGLKHPDDIITLALHRLMVHARLHQHPAIRGRIDDAVQGKAALASGLAALRDRDWQRIVSDLTYGAGQ